MGTQGRIPSPRLSTSVSSLRPSRRLLAPMSLLCQQLCLGQAPSSPTPHAGSPNPPAHSLLAAHVPCSSMSPLGRASAWDPRLPASSLPPSGLCSNVPFSGGPGQTASDRVPPAWPTQRCSRLPRARVHAPTCPLLPRSASPARAHLVTKCKLVDLTIN